MIKSTFFEFWKSAEIDRGRRITVAEVAKATGLRRNTIQGLLNGETTRFDAPVIDALCCYFNVPAGPIPFLVYEPDDENTEPQP